MMGITFSSQPISEITDVLTGTSTVGSFRGKGIDPEMYRAAYGQCDAFYQRYGDVPDYFIQNCATQRLRDYSTYPVIGRELGLSVSEAQLEKELVEEVKAIYEQQQSYQDPDDRLTMKQIYMRQVQNSPISIRKTQSEAGVVGRALAQFPYPDSIAKSSVQAEQTRVSLSFIRFNNAELLRSLGKEVTVTDEEARKLYEEKKYEDSDERPSFESQKEILVNEVRNEKRQKALAAVKGKLSDLKNPTMKEITSITFIQPYNPPPLSLLQLNQVPTGGKEAFNLAIPDALMAISQGPSRQVYGPFTADGYTVYLTVNQVMGNDQDVAFANLEKQKKNGSQFLAQSLVNLLSEHVADKGKFELNRRVLPGGDPSRGGAVPGGPPVGN